MDAWAKSILWDEPRQAISIRLLREVVAESFHTPQRFTY